MRPKSIRTALVLAFAGVVAIVLAQGILSYWKGFRAEYIMAKSYHSSFAEEVAADNMLKAAHDIRVNIRSPEKHGEVGEEISQFLEGVEESIRATRASMDSVKYLGKEDRVAEEEAEIVLLGSLQRFGDEMAGIWQEATSVGVDVGVSVQERVIGIVEREVLPRLYSYREQSREDLAREGNDILKVVSGFGTLLVSAILICLFISVVAGFFLYRRIIGPVNEITRDVEKLSAVNAEGRIAPTGAKEMDRLGTSFNALMDSLEEANRKRDELKELAEKRSHELSRVLELVPDIVCAVDFSGRMVEVNRGFERVLGYSREEVMATNIFDLIHPDDREAAVVETESILVEGRVVRSFENRYRHKNGEWRNFSWSADPSVEEGIIYAIGRDVTDQVRAREEEEKSFEKALQSRQALIRVRDSVQSDRQKFFEQVTEACVEILGVDRASVWQFVEETNQAVRIDLYEPKENAHGAELTISLDDYPAYFKAIKRLAPLAVEDVYSDPVTREFAEKEYRPLGICSILDVPIRAGGTLSGILSCEQVGESRSWTDSDVKFLSEIVGSVLLQFEFEERNEAERKLRASEEYNRSIVENSEDCLKVLSVDGRLLDMADPGKRIMEVSDFEEIRNSDWPAFWSEPYRTEVRKAVKTAAGGKAVRFRGQCPTMGGRHRWWDVIVSPIMNASGEVYRLLAVSRDVTEQKEAEQQLEEFNESLEQEVMKRTTELVSSEERFRMMIEQVKDYAIFMLDPEGKVVTWNAGAERLMNFRQEEILGRHFSVFYPENDVEEGLPEHFLAIAREKGRYRLEGWHIRKDGSRFWAEVMISSIYAPDGKMRGFVKVTRDLTERREADQALKKAFQAQKELTRKAQAGERAKSDFLAVMSHELRTPMNGIIGFSELLLGSSDLSDEDRDFVETLSESSHGLLRILDDILDFISSESGTMHIEKAPFQPRKLLEEVRLVISPLAAKKGLALLLDVGEEVPDKLDSDGARLRQIMMNLLGNAVKFTKEGSVRLSMNRLEKEGDELWWRISVEDTGPGIPKPQREEVFDPFYQADSSSSRRFDGSGLGLSISRRLAELMGGTLEFDSGAEMGSTFVLNLPMKLAEPEKNEGSKNGSSEEVQEKLLASEIPLKIMVVEDNLVNRKMMMTLLSKLGYDPIFAKDGKEALEVYKTSRPQCIFMDLQMPEMNGVEATEAIRKFEDEEKWAPAFISALTANTVIADRTRCFQAGMSFYLNKPVRRNTVIAVLMQAEEFLKENATG